MAITTTDIDDAGKEPKRVRTDEGTVEEKSIGDLIAADRYSNAKATAGAVPWGISIARGKPQGTVPGSNRT